MARTLSFYGVIGGEATYAHSTRREAEAEARETSLKCSEVVIVERVTTVPLDRATVIRLINVEGGYVDGSEFVARFANGRRVK